MISLSKPCKTAVELRLNFSPQQVQIQTVFYFDNITLALQIKSFKYEYFGKLLFPSACTNYVIPNNAAVVSLFYSIKLSCYRLKS